MCASLQSGQSRCCCAFLRMTVPLSLNINCEDVSSIKMEAVAGNGEQPMINMVLSLNIKIPVLELVGALADFQKKHEARSMAVGMATSAAESKAAHVGNQPGRVVPMAPPPPALAEGASPETGATANGGGPYAPMARAAPAPGLELQAAAPAPAPRAPEPPRPEVHATWDTEIAQLQANHDEYVKKVKWNYSAAANGGWTKLDDESCLINYVPVALEPTPLTAKQPGAHPRADDPLRMSRSARPAPATPLASEGDALEASPERGRPPPPPEPASALEPGAVDLRRPPSGAPPPPPAAAPQAKSPGTPGVKASIGDGHPSPPPGLVAAPAAPAPQTGPPAAASRAGGTPKEPSKECKQQ